MTAAKQAGREVAVLFLTLVIAIISGLIFGFIIKLKWFGNPEFIDDMFRDDKYWEMDEETLVELFGQ